MRATAVESHFGRLDSSSSIHIAEKGRLTPEDELLALPLTTAPLAAEAFQWCVDKPLSKSMVSADEGVETEVVKEGTELSSDSSVSWRLGLGGRGGVAGGGGKP